MGRSDRRYQIIRHSGYGDWLKKRERLAYIKMMENEAVGTNKTNPELEAIKMQMQQVLKQNKALQGQLLESQRKQRRANGFCFLQ